MSPVISAYLLGIPSIVHEQTSRPGLVNCISSFFSKNICISFFSSRDHFPFWVNKESLLFTGYPLRKVIAEGINCKNPIQKPSNPHLLFLGGGNGSIFINQVVEKTYRILQKDFFIYHQTGNTIFSLKESKKESYQAFNFSKNIYELISQSSCVICRSGAGIVCELIALKKPAIFFPLKSSRFSEQRYNAEEAKKYIPCTIFLEPQLEEKEFYSAIKKYSKYSKNKKSAYSGFVEIEKNPTQLGNGTKNIISVIYDILKRF